MEKKKLSKKALTILIGIGALVLAIAIIASAILIRTDIKRNDFTMPTKASSLLKFGVPYNWTIGSDVWEYKECITVHGILVDRLTINFTESSYEIVHGEHNADGPGELGRILSTSGWEISYSSNFLIASYHP